MRSQFSQTNWGEKSHSEPALNLCCRTDASLDSDLAEKQNCKTIMANCADPGHDLKSLVQKEQKTIIMYIKKFAIFDFGVCLKSFV